MDKKEFYMKFKAFKRNQKCIRVVLKNTDVVFADDYENTKGISKSVWLLWNKEKIAIIDFKNISFMD